MKKQQLHIVELNGETYTVSALGFESVFSEHQSSDGRVSLICQMSDDHLKNTLATLIRHAVMSSPQNNYDVDFDPLTRSMIQHKQEEYNERTRSKFLFMLKCIEPYLLEATIRGIVIDFIPVIQALFSRSAAVNSPQKTQRIIEDLLPCVDYTDDNELDL